MIRKQSLLMHLIACCSNPGTLQATKVKGKDEFKLRLQRCHNVCYIPYFSDYKAHIKSFNFLKN